MFRWTRKHGRKGCSDEGGREDQELTFEFFLQHRVGEPGFLQERTMFFWSNLIVYTTVPKDLPRGYVWSVPL